MGGGPHTPFLSQQHTPLCLRPLGLSRFPGSEGPLAKPQGQGAGLATHRVATIHCHQRLPSVSLLAQQVPLRPRNACTASPGSQRRHEPRAVPQGQASWRARFWAAKEQPPVLARPRDSGLQNSRAVSVVAQGIVGWMCEAPGPGQGRPECPTLLPAHLGMLVSPLCALGELIFLCPCGWQLHVNSWTFPGQVIVLLARLAGLRAILRKLRIPAVGL